MAIHSLSDDNGKLACNAHLPLKYHGCVFLSGNTHIGFEMIDGTFNDGSDFVGVKLFFRVREICVNPYVHRYKRFFL